MVPSHQVQLREQRQSSQRYDSKFLLAPSPCTNTALPLSEDNVAERAKPDPQPTSNIGERAEKCKSSNQSNLHLYKDCTERDSDKKEPPLGVLEKQKAELDVSSQKQDASSVLSCTKSVGMNLESAQQHSSATTTKNYDDNQTSKNVKLVNEQGRTNQTRQQSTKQKNERQIELDIAVSSR